MCLGPLSPNLNISDFCSCLAPINSEIVYFQSSSANEGEDAGSCHGDEDYKGSDVSRARPPLVPHHAAARPRCRSIHTTPPLTAMICKQAQFNMCALSMKNHLIFCVFLSSFKVVLKMRRTGSQRQTNFHYYLLEKK